MVVDTGLDNGQIVIDRPQEAVNIRQLSTILYRRRWLILGVAGIVISVATLISVVVKPTRESSMQILVSSNIYQGVNNPYNQNSLNNDFTDSNIKVVDYTAQLQLMRSKKLIERAVKLLRPTYPNITVEDIKGQKGKKGPLTVTQIQAGTGANKVPSEVFEVSFKDKNPVKAQKVLQALQIVYQDFNREQQQERLSKGLAFVNERLPKIKQQVIESETNLENFRQKYNILDPQIQSTILLESLAGIKKDLDSTTAQLQDVEARYRNLEEKLAASPQNALISSRLSQSTRYQSLLDEIQKTELALAQERQRFTDNSPTVQKLLEQRQSQMALLRQETERSLGDKANQTNNTAQPLLTKGQLAGVDLKLVEDLVRLQTEVLGLRANQQSLMQSESQIRLELNKYPNLIAEYSRLLPEVETSRKTLEELMNARQSLALRIAQGGFDWQILEQPELGIKTGRSRMLILFTGAVIGPILGIALALILELLSDTIYSPQELTRFTNLRLLGKIPKLLPPRKTKKLFGLPIGKLRSQHSLQKQKLYPSFSEAIAYLPSHETLDMAYQNIQILKYPQHCQSLMITSAKSGEGKSISTLGLAVSAARMHQRVLVIDANLRNPSLHTMMELSNDWGLSLLLLDETNTPISDYIQPVHPAIDVLTAGPIPDDTVKLLSSRRMKELLDTFTQNYDLVLIDASSILETVDARILASLCNGIIMVARMGKIKQSELIQATQILHNLNLVGIIANVATKSPKLYV
ncbi:MAG: polysaccharide biosynthesis tyrosine autokinase [Richelia sp. RM2_1_2]|nr:polysaccharide biosynthesis tyrosine autokinase [Richelia sp. SM1_7_0]NJN12435.1 polysaccharide biosynthesis tyrosine autokinase [Richelia sp. RM1_1_1]NJO27681.1 polysaccharide biosynthesis tyrosine autokinase [Richelia sp. SL_2_1]NJO63725.1 polysaccharide biosynthesis tyrosine autokinase [Richelia sp. RM2_1_2]